MFVDLAVANADKITGKGQPLSEAAYPGKHINELNQGYNEKRGNPL
jgi:hypothetical protein